MKKRIYVESSTISYLTSSPSRNLIIAAKQQVTKDFWYLRNHFELFISQTVLDEIRCGNPQAASLRIEAIEGIPILPRTDEVIQLTQILIQNKGVPASEEQDAAHIAHASVYGMYCLLSWNQKHIANQYQRRRVEEIILSYGMVPPLLMTPEELIWEIEKDEKTKMVSG